MPDTVVFHAGTRRENGRVLTNGGRVVGVTAWADDLRGALDRAYAAVDVIHWPGAMCRRDIGATNYPARDVYDSNDASLLDAHIADAEGAGIDAYIASWWGAGDFTDLAFAALLDRIEAQGSAVRACPYYENVPGGSAENALADLLFILDQYGTREAFFKVDGRPVLFIYGRAMGQISAGEWNWVIDQARLRVRTVICKSEEFTSTRFSVPSMVHPPCSRRTLTRGAPQSFWSVSAARTAEPIKTA